MNKESMTPLEWTLAGLLGGAGMYGLHRGAHDISRMFERKSSNPQDLVIPLPINKLHPQEDKQKNEPMQAVAEEGDSLFGLVNSGNATRKTLDVVGAIGGSLAGYAGASGLYEHFKKRRIEREKDEIEKKYLHRLSTVADKEKYASCMDCFVAGVTDQFTEMSLKQAEEPEGLGSLISNAVKANVQPVVTGAGKFIGESVTSAAKAMQGPIREGGGDYLDSAAAGAAALALLSGLGVYGLGTYAGKKKSPEEQDLPQNVRIVPTEMPQHRLA